MKKSNLKFQFIYPLNEKKVDIHRPGGWKYVHIADLLVTGVGYKFNGFSSLDPIEERYDFDLESIMYNDCDVLALLSALDLPAEIENACLHHIHSLFNGEPSEFEIPDNNMELQPFPRQRVPIK